MARGRKHSEDAQRSPPCIHTALSFALYGHGASAGSHSCSEIGRTAAQRTFDTENRANFRSFKQASSGAGLSVGPVASS